MNIYLTAPGYRKIPVILPDSATVADFARKAFQITGLPIFSGFGYQDAGVAYTVPLTSNVYTATGFDHPIAETPTAPTVTATTGTGTLAANTYYTVVSYVASVGFSLPSPQTSTVLSATGELTVSSPAVITDPFTTVTGYNVYMGTTNGSGWKLQNANPIPLGTSFVLSTPITTNGAVPPSITTISFANVQSTTAINTILANNAEFVVFDNAIG